MGIEFLRPRHRVLRRLLVIAVSVSLISLLSACGPPPPTLSLVGVIDQENAESVQQHIEGGTDPDVEFIPPGYPFAGASALHQAVLIGNVEVVDLLLDGGANIDIRARDVFEATPLIWAAYWGMRDMVRLLVEAGAKIKAEDAFGSTALEAADSANPFIPEGTREEFDANREIIKQYLLGYGG